MRLGCSQHIQLLSNSAASYTGIKSTRSPSWFSQAKGLIWSLSRLENTQRYRVSSCLFTAKYRAGDCPKVFLNIVINALTDSYPRSSLTR